MSKQVSLTIEQRDTSKNPRQLRSEGVVPATIYGKDLISTKLHDKIFVFCYVIKLIIDI